MKRFEVENTEKMQKITVTLFNPPYETENVLYKTGWKEKDVVIKDVTPVFEDE